MAPSLLRLTPPAWCRSPTPCSPRRSRPSPACRARFELVAHGGHDASSTGTLIQVGDGFIAGFGDDELAAVIAHELAHTILHHRQRLEAAKVSQGLFAEFGRSKRLNARTEAEADLLSVHLLRNAGYDPAAALRLWRNHAKALDAGILRSAIYASPAARARAMAAEIAAIPANAPIPEIPSLIATRNQPLQ